MAIVEVDFTDVQTGAGFLEPGLYRAQVEAVEKREGRSYPGLKWTWASIEPETMGQRADGFTSLAPQSLWVLKGILEAFGVEVPQSALRFDTEKLIGKRALIKVYHEPWTDGEGNQKTSSKVDKVFAITKDGNGQKAAEPAPPSDLTPARDYKDVEFEDDDDSIPF